MAVMSSGDEFLEAIRKRALGYEVEETQTLVEETPRGTVKKVVRTRRHVPPDLACAEWLIRHASLPRRSIRLAAIEAELAKGGRHGDNED